MSEQTIDKQNTPEQLSDILLVLDKEKKKIQAVKSIDENGKMETVNPDKKKSESIYACRQRRSFLQLTFCLIAIC